MGVAFVLFRVFITQGMGWTLVYETNTTPWFFRHLETIHANKYNVTFEQYHIASACMGAYQLWAERQHSLEILEESLSHSTPVYSAKRAFQESSDKSGRVVQSPLEQMPPINNFQTTKLIGRIVTSSTRLQEQSNSWLSSVAARRDVSQIYVVVRRGTIIVGQVVNARDALIYQWCNHTSKTTLMMTVAVIVTMTAQPVKVAVMTMM